jgi:nitrate reductase delta subunit
MEPETIFGQLAALFEYPSEGYVERARDCAAAIESEQPQAAALFNQFCREIDGLSTDELQELFTRTFDLNPACTLEIGWQLYGEDYRRGEFLVHMRQGLREKELSESAELPDHLTHALALLGRLEPDEASEFAGRFLLPALDKMLAAWKKDRNAYAALLESTFTLLTNRFTYEPERRPVRVPELVVLD